MSLSQVTLSQMLLSQVTICHMAMPQWCYLAKGAKRPNHTTNTIKFDRIPLDPCNLIKMFDLCPFDQKNLTYLQPPLSIDVEKAFDSVWVDGLLFKQLQHNISGKLYRIINLFSNTRVASSKMYGYEPPKFQISIGVLQGNMFWLLLSIIFLNNFLSNQTQKFKFADDSSVFVTGKFPSELSAILRKTCSDIERSFADWRMLVNWGKFELILSNCEENNFELPSLNGDVCRFKKKQQQSLSE